MMPVNLRKNTKLPFSKSKKLIVSGCSYADRSMLSDPVWPELLAKKLKMDCINLGRAGQGNEYIYSSILDTVVKEKNIGIVIAMWSEFQRLDFFINKGQAQYWTSLHFPESFGTKDRHKNEWKNKMMRTLKEEGYGYDNSNIRRSLRIFYMFQQTMKSLNIPFLHLMGPFPISRMNSKVPSEWLNEIIDSKYLTLIDRKLFLGWPMLPEIGGWNFDTILDNYDYEDVRISLDDCHPNAKGHKVISDKIYRNYESKYGTIF